MKTIDSLGVFWSFVDESTGEIYQEEVDGLIFTVTGLKWKCIMLLMIFLPLREFGEAQ